MEKLSYQQYGRNVLSYLALEYECEPELDHSHEGVVKARRFIKKCYGEDLSVPDCCGLLVRKLIRKKESSEKPESPEEL
jgi:hypothetical protein